MNRSVLPHPIRLLYFIPDMGGGGAERAVVDYLCHHDRQRFEPLLVLCNEGGVHLDDLPRDIERYSLRKKTALSLPAMCYRFFRLVKRLKPHAIVSFVWYANAIHLLTSTCIGKRLAPLAVCSVDAMSNSFEEERLGPLKFRIMKWLYPASDACFGVSAAVVDDFKRHFAPQGPVWVQPNPFDLERICPQAESGEARWPQPGTRLLAVGRLVRQKGFDVLLTGLARLRHLPWSLIILGEGSEREALQLQIKSLNLDARVSLAGYVDNPFVFMKTADLLVCPSRAEGLGRVLIEALTLGTPIIATNCPGGPAEVLEEGKLGCLVPVSDSAALAGAIEKAITDDKPRAPTPSLQRFDAHRVVADWKARLQTLLEGRVG